MKSPDDSFRKVGGLGDDNDQRGGPAPSAALARCRMTALRQPVPARHTIRPALGRMRRISTRRQPMSVGGGKWAEPASACGVAEAASPSACIFKDCFRFNDHRASENLTRRHCLQFSSGGPGPAQPAGYMVTGLPPGALLRAGRAKCRARSDRWWRPALCPAHTQNLTVATTLGIVRCWGV